MMYSNNDKIIIYIYICIYIYMYILCMLCYVSKFMCVRLKFEDKL